MMSPPPAHSTDVLHDAIARIDTDRSASAGHVFADLIAGYLERARTGGDSVSTLRTAREIEARLAGPLPEHPTPLDEIVRRLAADVIPDSNWLHHPMAMGHQVAPPLPSSIWTESLIGALNQSLAVWEMSPVSSVLERIVVRWMCDLVGFGDRAGGTFTSGGTEATTTALVAARNAAYPDAWTDGIASGGVIVCGADAHYAVARAAGILGIGTSNLVTIPSRPGRMDVGALASTLDALIANGKTVVAVVATAGSTPTGSFDDLDGIADACDQRRLWLHVDGAHGASALLSTHHRPRLRGIERARSLAWDPHKMMLMPLSAGMLIVRDIADLDRAFAQRAPYLFSDDADDRLRDHGRRSFMCSRRADVLKLWVALHRHGRAELAALHDHLCATTHALWNAVRGNPRFEALHEPESNILCFRYVPPRTPGVAPDEEELDALNLRLRERLNRSGVAWITTTLLGGRRVLRVTVMNPRSGEPELRRLLDELAVLARS
jgi:L-2,4-diaminobutyrate decarboxylase